MQSTEKSITLEDVRARLSSAIDPVRAAHSRRYFKTGPGEYAEGDQFIGITVPELRRQARHLRGASNDVLTGLLRSPIHEERLLALLGMVEAYRKGTQARRDEVYRMFMGNREFVNNWDLVDSSAHEIVGRHLPVGEMTVLLDLSRSESVWDRRIAVIATLYDIRANDMSRILPLARVLLRDRHDLIQKAVGWMLREMGNRQPALLETFLDANAREMPRTMLRYAIEKFPDEQRKRYLSR